MKLNLQALLKQFVKLKNHGQSRLHLNGKQIKGTDSSRSLYVVKDIKKGEKITEENVRSIRPGFRLHPKHLPEALEKVANEDLEKGDRFELEFIK